MVQAGTARPTVENSEESVPGIYRLVEFVEAMEKRIRTSVGYTGLIASRHRRS